MRSTASSAVRELVVAALCLSLCILLPFLTGQIPQIGSMLSPMHIPVLLCGFLCRWPWAAGVGFIAPILRSMMLGMPPIFVASAMAFEMAAYGLVAAVVYGILPKKTVNIYVSLIVAMLVGRVVWGAASFVIYNTAMNTQFTIEMFLTGAFLQAIPGIIAHILLIPPLVLAIQKSGWKTPKAMAG